ncbi:PREDICTED: androgen-induced gene 1 protein [Tinamus guttatus]|nr:PREDICTED: androgen-induced gene 1 protein [Tinamus guttatus]
MKPSPYPEEPGPLGHGSGGCGWCAGAPGLSRTRPETGAPGLPDRAEAQTPADTTGGAEHTQGPTCRAAGLQAPHVRLRTHGLQRPMQRATARLLAGSNDFQAGSSDDLFCNNLFQPSITMKVIQAVFFGICVLTDLSSLLTKGNDSQEQERQLKKLISLRDWMMAVLAFPIGVFVVTMFWSIYIYDRELVYPKLLDNFIPAWLNHGMHTTVLPFILIEMRTTHHEYPSRSCGLAAVCTFAVGYILWVCWIHHVTGVWVYPLLEYLSPGVKIIFFTALTITINIFYLLGEVLNNYIWDTQKCIEEGKEKPKLE